MKSVCAWCFPGIPPGEDPEEITHGICPYHMEQIQQEAIAYRKKEVTEIKVRFEREKETKNTIRGTLYLQKWLAGDSKEFTITIEKEDTKQNSRH